MDDIDDISMVILEFFQDIIFESIDKLDEGRRIDARNIYGDSYKMGIAIEGKVDKILSYTLQRLSYSSTHLKDL